MITEFDSQNNKEFMWNLMYENGVFSDISSSKVDLVKKTFDKLFISIQKEDKYQSLSEKNKQVLLLMNERRGMFIQEDLPITSEETINLRTQELNKNFIKQQKEFDSGMNYPVPNDIDFSNAADKPIGSEMDNMIADAIEKRQNELNVVLQRHDPKIAGEWINKDNPPHIKIEDDIELIDKSVEKIENKHVTFGKTQIKEYDDNDDNKDFISMLKPAERQPDIDTRLKVIERNQTSIINILDRILQAIQTIQTK